VNNQTDEQLLTDYAESRSESAFAEIVRRHVDLVYSAALRMVGDAHAAKDVAQGVFVALAANVQNAMGRPLAGWLHCTARNLAAKVIRTEVRRRAREQEAATMNDLPAPSPELSWERIAPHLDAALGELPEPDRNAVLLRYFQNQDLRTVGVALGISDDAAQKRVSRALERLRDIFARRGVSIASSSLAVALSAQSVHAAPLGLAAVISGVAIAGTTASASTFIAATKILAMTTIQKTVVTLLVVAGIATPLIIHQRSAARERAAAEALQAESDRLLRMQAEEDRLAAAAAGSHNGNGRADELERLRTTAAKLRSQSNSLAPLRAEKARNQAAANLPDVEPTEAEQQQVQAAMAENKKWLMASYMYSRKNNGQFPSSMTALDPKQPTAPGSSTANQFEIVYQGAISAVRTPQKVIVMRQKEPIPYGNRWAKVYGYADGHAEMHVQAGKDFTEWERQHIGTNAGQP